MRLSLNFVKDYVDIDENIDVKELAEKMTAVGNEYDENIENIIYTNLKLTKEEIEYLRKKY